MHSSSLDLTSLLEIISNWKNKDSLSINSLIKTKKHVESQNWIAEMNFTNVKLKLLVQ